MTKIIKKENNVGIERRNFDDQKEMQNYIRSQIYFKGFTVGVGAGANASVGNISLGGQARKLYGILVFVPLANVADDDTLSLTINSEVIVDTCLWRTFNPTYNTKIEMFYPIPRPLSGSDSVQLSYTAINAKNVFLTFFLSNFAKKL